MDLNSCGHSQHLAIANDDEALLLNLEIFKRKKKKKVRLTD